MAAGKLCSDRLPTKQLIVESHPAATRIIVKSKPVGTLRVFVRGCIKILFVPGRHVTLDGFYKHPDGSVSTMPTEKMYEFD